MTDYVEHEDIIDMIKQADYQRFIHIHPSILAKDKSYWMYRAVLLYRIEHQRQDIFPKELNTIFFIRNKNKLIKRILGVSKKFMQVLNTCHKEAVARSSIKRRLQHRKLAIESNIQRKQEKMFIARLALMKLGAKA